METPPSPGNTPPIDGSKEGEERTCRICLDTVPPPYDPSPILGRLISPCVCSGSSRYVHSGCLSRWRTTSKVAYYQCPTCHYRYRLRRLTASRMLSSSFVQFFLSLWILVFIVWLLGFVSAPFMMTGYVVDLEDLLPENPEDEGWLEHFLRGLASLGLMGFVKVIYLLGPGTWWNLRNSGLLGNGRERTSRIGWLVVAVGVINFFIWLWKMVGDGVERILARMAWDVLEVGDVREEQMQGGLGDMAREAVMNAWETIIRWKDTLVAGGGPAGGIGAEVER